MRAPAAAESHDLRARRPVYRLGPCIRPRAVSHRSLAVAQLPIPQSDASSCAPLPGLADDAEGTPIVGEDLQLLSIDNRALAAAGAADVSDARRTAHEEH